MTIAQPIAAQMHKPTVPMTVSVILPVVDEVQMLHDTMRILLAENELDEILIITGKVTLPESRKAVEEIARAHPGLVTHRDQVRPFLGGALRDSFEWARGTHILMMASDLETDPHCVKDMIAKAREGWDIVTTTRWHDARDWEGYNPVKFVLNWVFQRTMSALFGTHLTDMTFGFRIFKREWCTKIKWEELRHPFLLETMIKPLRLGAKACEIPTIWKARTEGVSHNPFWRNFLYFGIAFRVRFGSTSALLRQPENS